MNQNNYIHQKKIIHQIPNPQNCLGCYNCSKVECNCNCTCHFHKNSFVIQNKKNFTNENEKNNSDNSDEENRNEINFNNNYEENIYQNIGTKIMSNDLMNNDKLPLPNINIDLSNNLNDLSKYYRDIYTKTKLELDIEKEKSIT